MTIGVVKVLKRLTCNNGLYMRTKQSLHIIIISLLLFTATMAFGRDFIIYSIVQELPMGRPNEVVKKNFYINIGKEQGVDEGTLLNVYRNISRVDPYATKKRYNYLIKIGQLKVVHSEDNAAIGKLEKIDDSNDDPLVEIEGLMIGDQIRVKLN